MKIPTSSIINSKISMVTMPKLSSNPRTTTITSLAKISMVADSRTTITKVVISTNKIQTLVTIVSRPSRTITNPTILPLNVKTLSTLEVMRRPTIQL